MTRHHTGLCVTDLEASTRFYRDALGFTPVTDTVPDDEPVAALFGLTSPLGLTVRYLERDDFILELFHFATGATDGSSPRARTVNAPGLTHLSITVDDLDAAAARVEDCGGTVLDQRIDGVVVLVRDPDGLLIELLPVGWHARELDR